MNLKNVFAILFALMFLSCANVKIKDSEFCGDMGSEGATCFNTLSNSTREISSADWDQERFGMVCSTASTFAEWKKAILKLCKMSRRCSYDTKKKIINYGDKLETLRIKIDENYYPEER